MNSFKFLCVLFFVNTAIGATTFKLEFDKPRNVKIDLSLYELNRLSFEKVIGTHGDLLDDRQLDGGKKIKDFKVTLKTGDVKILGLVVENLTDKELDFFVSPHEANPTEYSLDFKFNCLCYSHVYKVKPKSRWYRIMRIAMSEEGTEAKTIILKHQIVKWDGKKSP